MNELFDGLEPLPDGYAIVAYPGSYLLDEVLGEKREIVPFYGQSRVGDFYRSSEGPIGEVRTIVWNYEEAVDMFEATEPIRMPLVKLIGRLITGN